MKVQGYWSVKIQPVYLYLVTKPESQNLPNSESFSSDSMLNFEMKFDIFIVLSTESGMLTLPKLHSFHTQFCLFIILSNFWFPRRPSIDQWKTEQSVVRSLGMLFYNLLCHCLWWWWSWLLTSLNVYNFKQESQLTKNHYTNITSSI